LGYEYMTLSGIFIVKWHYFKYIAIYCNIKYIFHGLKKKKNRNVFLQGFV